MYFGHRKEERNYKIKCLGREDHESQNGRKSSERLTSLLKQLHKHHLGGDRQNGGDRRAPPSKELQTLMTAERGNAGLPWAWAPPPDWLSNTKWSTLKPYTYRNPKLNSTGYIYILVHIFISLSVCLSVTTEKEDINLRLGGEAWGLEGMDTEKKVPSISNDKMKWPHLPFRWLLLGGWIGGRASCWENVSVVQVRDSMARAELEGA